ncbi:MAG TPA: hypothetical protein VKT00_10500 [Casimicrobiaceae bacterium]|nr:hypothetical protein [Casimicrobiaceae bacterium]
MDELLRYASLAGAGLPAHERHRAKNSTVRQLQRIEVERDGTLRISRPHACGARADPATLAGVCFSLRDPQGNDHLLLRIGDDRAPTDAAHRGEPAPARKARKLILLSY